jgi:hypothetical protein
MTRLEPPTDPPMTCHVCGCRITTNDYETDDEGYRHGVCYLQVTL